MAASQDDLRHASSGAPSAQKRPVSFAYAGAEGPQASGRGGEGSVKPAAPGRQKMASVASAESRCCSPRASWRRGLAARP